MAPSRMKKVKNTLEKKNESEPGSEGTGSGSSEEERVSRLATEMQRKVNLDSSEIRSQIS